MPPPKLGALPIATTSILYEKRVLLNNLKRRSLTEKVTVITKSITLPLITDKNMWHRLEVAVGNSNDGEE
jgi:hypothetical protein